MANTLPNLKFANSVIAHSHSTYARGLDMINGTYQLLDLTPLGCNEDEPLDTMAWVRRSDQYES